MSSEKHPFVDEIFHPKSIAVIGASASKQETGWVARLLRFGYPGRIYPINPRASEISGLKAYPTVRDVPDPVDYAIFNVPIRLTLQVMEDCVAKGVKVVHVFTAGFSETGIEEMKQLEARLAAIAQAGGVRMIGPNCNGVYCPAAGLTQSDTFSKEPGSVAFVSQSGAGVLRFIPMANERGIHFSKAISYGNAVDVDAPELLEYLASDNDTRIITCYIEGVRDGRRFLQAVNKCLRTKPVIIMKAGLTEGGAGAAASHTASLAGSVSVWEAFFKQTGTISVNSLEEIADVTIALLYMPCPKGRRAGIVGRGGGLGVMATDTAERAGLKVPPFLLETRRQLEEIIPEVGATHRNPVESPTGLDGFADFYTKGLKLVDADSQIDFLLIHLGVDVYARSVADLQQRLVQTTETLASSVKTLAKPVAVVLHAGENLKTITAVLEARNGLLKAGIPVYPTIEVATRAVSKLITYHEFAEGGKPAA